MTQTIEQFQEMKRAMRATNMELEKRGHQPEAIALASLTTACMFLRALGCPASAAAIVMAEVLGPTLVASAEDPGALPLPGLPGLKH